MKPDYTLHIPVLDKTVWLFVGKGRRKEMFEYVAKKNKQSLPEDMGRECDAYGTQWGGGIWLLKKTDFSTLLHECYHMTKAISNNLDEIGEEVEARTLSYIYDKMRKVLEAM